MNIQPIEKTGPSRTGTLETTYDNIVKTLGFEPNATHLDDPGKVRASWGFVDADTGREGFIWCYKIFHPEMCTSWSTFGDVVQDLFGDPVT